MAKSTSGRKKKSKQATQTPETHHAWRLVAKLGLAGLWLLLAASFISFDPADPPGEMVGIQNEPVRNWVGGFGAFIAYEARLMLGPGIWVILAGLTLALWTVMRGKDMNQPVMRSVGTLVVAVSFAGLMKLTLPDQALGAATPAPSGLAATYLTDQLNQRFAWLGSMVILGIILFIGAVLAADSLVLALPRLVTSAVARVSDLDIKTRLTARKPVSQKQVDKPQRKTRKPRGTKRGRKDDTEEWIDTDAGGLGGVESFDPEEHTVTQEDEDEGYEYVDEEGNPIDPADLEEYEAYDDSEEDADEEYEDEDDDIGAPAAYIEQKREFSKDELREKIRQLPINFTPRSQSKSADLPREVDLSGYQFPGMDLLDEPDEDNSNARMELVQNQGIVLQEAMKEYNIDGEVVGIDSGPTITLYEVRLAPGTKVNSLNRVSSDLARSLKAHNVRIVPNMVGKDTVGIEVPNLEREKVSLCELMNAGNDSSKMRLPMWLGKDASGEPLIHDLSTMPHMLIAGTTGSGKSVCTNAIIMSLLFTKRPDELKMVLVDPKMVEMTMYKDIPHLMCPVVTEMGKAAAILEWAVTKMDERYELLAEAGVRDIKTYNDLGWEEIKERMAPANESEEARIPKKLPYIVFVIDELADLMMTNKEVESHIVRIAQKARAVGMHLILATQRPQANVVTGLIKGNMPCRVSFRVASKLDSRIVLDQGGAELLLGHGDMLFLNPKTSKVTRCQGAFVDDLEIRRTVKFLKKVAQPSFEPALVQIKSEANIDHDEKDDMFDQAVEVVLDTQRGSVSLLQRRLSIGYSRASRLIEQMENYGILGAHKTAQAREVLISGDEWFAMKAQAEADADAGEEEEYEYDEEGSQVLDEVEEDQVPDEFDDEYRQ